MVIETYVIKDIQQLTDTFQALNSLIDNPMSAALCTSEAWLTHWLAYYPSPQDKIFVCCHRIGAQFIAVYPLYLKKISFGYELRFIGSGEPEQAEVCSEFQDFIISPAYLQQSLALFTEQVKKLKHCYRIAFDKILASSICYKWLKSYTAAGRQYREQYVGKRFLLPIAANELSQIKQLPQATLRRHARRFIERRDITVEYCQQQQDIPDFFETLISLHTAHWQQRGKSGAFSSEQFRQFHLGFAVRMLQQNKLLLFKLIHDNNTIAVFYGFYHQNTLYYYQSGISAESPLSNTGIGMHLVAIRNARAAKCDAYDLMQGGDQSYKQQYVQASTGVYSVTSSIFWYALIFNLKKIKRIKTKLDKLIRSIKN